ncbi:hypothetical protein P4O66_018808 [Electrophorus voltai]|uniref:Reverse transcriptase domain-containing protein n=1 Tax=Electrophorus voltai TaxID=2609070 RepID=A0AAD8YQM0_9TELE|nr:hypothetical protein P4O66_018808 [Electrophorus voltai]
MDQYITEALEQGYIPPLYLSGVGQGLFVKKDGGLRPCVDYRGPNKLLIQYPYPFPALEQLRGASLATALSIFQAYINKVLREFLGRSIVTYINDILIYSSSWN